MSMAAPFIVLNQPCGWWSLWEAKACFGGVCCYGTINDLVDDNDLQYIDELVVDVVDSPIIS